MVSLLTTATGMALAASAFVAFVASASLVSI
eukprot:CAMPEP_0194248042 /NCGR_PEP_ID=MMETSP0158-20130606/17494_1 /TAXON_ID=33649 /ORGANISM="Thalassionema nitzschioides, Strain L26-B" /LENGTH=30 /DNA_ID= /DNA_START= /DNA_END= /DNA_ORIENTATION=